MPVASAVVSYLRFAVRALNPVIEHANKGRIMSFLIQHSIQDVAQSRCRVI